MNLPGWNKMNLTERRAFLAAAVCFLLAVGFAALAFVTDISVFTLLFDFAFAVMFAAMGITDLRRHKLQAVGEFLTSAAILLVGITNLIK